MMHFESKLLDELDKVNELKARIKQLEEALEDCMKYAGEAPQYKFDEWQKALEAK